MSAAHAPDADRAAFTADGIGTLVWRICGACHVGNINKISIGLHHQRHGLGQRLIRRALADGLEYTWQATGQCPQARQFFP
ncbi:hypothetical protein [Streptomyces sp. NPDC058964]|uniref:hypothetical protein n=1 Tax=Streptomyces sp. NPDC058964 TaxID=3346681 RepID=UPI0036B2CDEA